MSGQKAIGIDLGTCYSCVAVFQNGKIEIIADDQGSRTTPSCVAFTETERLIGDAAKNQILINPHNTVFDIKRLIGRKFDDTSVQSDIKFWPFKVIPTPDGNPKVLVNFKNCEVHLNPEEISAMVLVKMKETAEAFLDAEVKDAVITVPAYFNDSQRQATIDAGKIAGLNVLRIISEPTAAAIAYGLDKKVEEKRTVLIFDLGGGTFDVTIVEIENKNVTVKATSGDTHLGGEDFDNLMVTYFAEKFKRKHKNDLTSNPRSLRRLRSACESAKRTLSASSQASIEVNSLFDGIDFSTVITRALFEELCSTLFKSTIETVEKALLDAKLGKEKIDDIVLVGGSTRIPKIQKLLSEFFNGKELNKTINPDEAVAHGAAIQAAILSGNVPPILEDTVIRGVIPLSLGIDVITGEMISVIRKNTPIPVTVTRRFFTTEDYQESVPFRVYEGQRYMSKDNNLLGEFMLSGITRALRGETKLDVTFEVDDNGVLKVVAEDKKSGRGSQITISNSKGRHSTDDITRMIKNSELFKDIDNAYKECVEARNALENYAYDIKNSTQANSSLLRECEHIIRWLNSNSTIRIQDVEARHRYLQNYSEYVKNRINRYEQVYHL